MVNKWFMADLHLNHEFMTEIDPMTGQSYRPFKTVEEMNNTIIDNINKVVKPKDKLYLMGDVLFKPATSEHLLKRIKGKKQLIIGNHDDIKKNTRYYVDHFDKILLWKKFKDEGFVCTHIPLRPDGIRDCILNVHGHIHKANLPEPCYLNVSAENTNYAPVHMDTVLTYVSVLNGLILNGRWVPPAPIAH